MEQLAKAGGVTKPILYRHFGDRDGLIDAIAERFSTELILSVTAPLQTETYPRASSTRRSAPTSASSSATPTCTGS